MKIQGDVIAVYNDVGVKLVSYDYNAWGKFMTAYYNGGASTKAADNPFTYRGYYYDGGLGFYYLGTRYYDPVVKRFINADNGVRMDIRAIGSKREMHLWQHNQIIDYTRIHGVRPPWNKSNW